MKWNFGNKFIESLIFYNHDDTTISFSSQLNSLFKLPVDTSIAWYYATLQYSRHQKFKTPSDDIIFMNEKQGIQIKAMFILVQDMYRSTWCHFPTKRIDLCSSLAHSSKHDKKGAVGGWLLTHCIFFKQKNILLWDGVPTTNIRLVHQIKTVQYFSIHVL